MPSRPFLLLVVIDGLGCRKQTNWNAFAEAKTPVFDRLFSEEPWTTLEASGLAVGLPPGQMGNSEVGHLNIGAGRIVDQDIVRISKAIERGELAKNPVLVDLFRRVKESGCAVHFAGLLSEGGVHSLQSHLHGLIDAAIANGLESIDGMPRIFIHAILDGRDTPPMSAVANLSRLNEFLEDKPQTALSTIIGRYYAMDRDKRWERINKAWDLWTLGIGTESSDPIASVERFYEANITDEFMEPIAVLASDGAHRGKIRDGDAVLLFNFRADRMRQIVSAFRDDDFQGFEREIRPKVDLVSMNRYHQDFDFPVIFPPQKISNHLGEVFAAQGMKQLRIAETEKYAHVTFFFNGGSDTVSPGEERILIQSPKVATYDLQPEMSLPELSARVIEEIGSRKYDAIVMNIANPDMVGHTGVMDATVKAVAATDEAIGRILGAVAAVGGITLITADHGNCELMYDPATGQAHTAHTTNPVPLILIDPEKRYRSLDAGGALENVAPTILDILSIPKPSEMTAESLLGEDGSQAR
ncbi:MAG: 2,3-bisphosphoglycerate-independent phosphoglycerate mutase [Thermoanaerobaculia bacterium]